MDSNEKFDDEIEIDLKVLFLKLKSLWHVCILGLLVGAVLAAAYGMFLKAPQYESSSMIYLRSGSNTISLQDLSVGEKLTKDYEVIFKSRPNMEKVIDKLDLEMSAKTLSRMISIENLTNTRILKVSVISNDPNLSRDIANEVVNVGMDNVREIDSQEPYLIEKAIARNENVGTSTAKLTVIGALVGLMATVGVIFVQFILSDTIQSTEDIERTLNLPVLAVVTEDESLRYVKKGNHKNKKLGASK